MVKRIVCFFLVFLFISTPVLAQTTTYKQVYHGQKEDYVCLTFDDGYGKTSIETILKCLKEKKIKCTFFIIGSQLKAYPKLWQQAVKDGHEICYHSMKHTNLTKLTDSQIKNDINEWNTIAHRVLGKNYQIKKIARCPGGNANQRVLKLLNSLGYQAIYWSDDTYSTVIKYHSKDPIKTVANLIATHITSNTKSKSIILFHFNQYDSAALPDILKKICTNYKFCTVSEALASK
jgi:peptidoglycan/xylan/chitin deacetylase (PgdA/CDA1 family)